MKNNLTDIIHTRSGRKAADKPEPDKSMAYRELSIRKDAAGIPATLDTENRSVEVIGATEDPVEVFDYERYETVLEILLMDGVELPKSRQVPLLDTHNRWDGTSSVLGSFREMKTENGQLTGRATFTSAPEAESPYTKLREGHLTDFSVGYRVIDSEYIPNGEKRTIKGRTFEGPVRVTSRWRVKEMSICPIGADENAKARAPQTPKPNSKKEHPPMNKKLRDLLIKRGMSADVTDAEAWAYFDTLFSRGEINVDGSARAADPPAGSGTPTPAPASPPPPDPDAVRADAARVERARITEISAMCRHFGLDEAFSKKLIDDNKSEDQARAAVLDAIGNRQAKPNPGYRVMIDMGADERDKFRAAAQDAIVLRAGLSGVKIDKPAPGADELRGFSLVELARHSLRVAGQSIGGRPLEMVGRAMTTSDFPYLLANVANKSLFVGWETAGETWSTWCGLGQVSDFKKHYSVRASEASDLDEIAEAEEYKYGKRTEAQEEYQIATYGKLFAITRQTIINDDLNALVNIPASHGEAAARKIGDLPYAVLTANANMGDSVALFHQVTHGNYTGGSGAAPGVSTLAAGILAMKSQKDLQGLRRLNIRPQYFIAPAALEGASEQFFLSNSMAYVGATDAEKAPVNPYAGNYFTRVYESRLDDNDAAMWYLAAAKGKTVVVYFLDGVQAPYMETKQGWSVDGVEYKVRIDAGAKAMDWRGLYCNDGN